MFEPEPGRFIYYLEDTIVVDWHAPEILARADAIAAAHAGDLARARASFEWVRDEIAHTGDAGLDAVPCRASEVLAAGTGIGFSKSHLLAALLRALDLPAGFGYQVLRHPEDAERTLLYGFNGVLLPSLDRWIALDARGNREGLETSFETERLSLGVMANPDRGEFVYPTIFARPAKVVVELLKGVDRLDDLAGHVPERLPDVPDPVPTPGPS